MNKVNNPYIPNYIAECLYSSNGINYNLNELTGKGNGPR